MQNVDFNDIKVLEEIINLSIERCKDAASQKPFKNGEVYCDPGPHFDQECRTLISLLETRRLFVQPAGWYKEPDNEK